MDITVIIRTVSERTAKLCYEQVMKQVPKENIYIINEIPFTEALHKTYEIGIRQNRKWTFVVDADVLILPNTINQLIKIADKENDDVFEIQGLIYDKFFLVNRPAGNHLYRTNLLSKAIDFISKQQESIRPEYDTITKMMESGHPYLQTDVIVGLHDFEQYYSDIFRKSMVQAHKHNYLLPLLKPIWEELKTDDFDYQIALWGATFGTINNNITINKKFYQSEIEDIFNFKNIKEKDEILFFDHEKLDVNNDRYQLQNKIFHKQNWNRRHVNKIKPTEQEIENNIFLYKLGCIIEKIGIEIKRLAL